tara:strand:- start:4663 stop:5118 length:456 start_codon:yes stop_codon:yes gene_type:complete
VSRRTDCWYIEIKTGNPVRHDSYLAILDERDRHVPQLVFLLNGDLGIVDPDAGPGGAAPTPVLTLLRSDWFYDRFDGKWTWTDEGGRAQAWFGMCTSQVYLYIAGGTTSIRVPPRVITAGDRNREHPEVMRRIAVCERIFHALQDIYNENA